PVQKTVQTTPPASPYAPSRTAVSEEKNSIVLPAPSEQPVVQNQQPPKPAYTVTRPVWNQAITTTPAASNPPASVTQAPVQPAQPSDWRKSWGKLPERAKVDDTPKKSEVTAKNDAPAKPK